MEKEKDVTEKEIDVTEKDSDLDLSINDSEIAVDDKSHKKHSNKPSALFIKISCILCLIVLIASFIVGLTLPKSDISVKKQIDILHETDEDYTQAKSDNEALSKGINDLKSDIAEKQQELDEFTSSQSVLDNILEENEALQQESDSLTRSISEKKSTLDSLNKTAEKQKTAAVTLSSGQYTVGERIAAGTYTVYGTGSIVISTSGKARVNTTLSADGQSYTLSSDDIIKISGTARFMPE